MATQPLKNIKSNILLQFTLLLVLILAGMSSTGFAVQETQPTEIQFIFTSDPHYGITRDRFQGATQVDAHVVNAAMVAKINKLPNVKLPADGGINAGKIAGAIDFVVETGDIANRQEGTIGKSIPNASLSWAQFKADYIDGLNIKDRKGNKAPLYVLPGNHDITNAVGFYQSMVPPTDAATLAGIFNLMMNPLVPKDGSTYNYARDKIHYSLNQGGIHFVFLTLWPDSAEREWMAEDLKTIAQSTPVIMFVHDQPEVEAKHFINPNGEHDINSTDKFENLLSDQLAGGKKMNDPTAIEQRQLEAFFKSNPNISVYFHGNDHWKRFRDWTGPDNTIAVHTFGADSPMKGLVSKDNETKLSFYLVTIDSNARLMSVRECLWNPVPSQPDAPVAWGDTITVALFPRPVVE
jgi:hypothetical protein